MLSVTPTNAFGAAYGQPQKDTSMEKRIITMDMSYCNSYGWDIKSYNGYDNSGFCDNYFQQAGENGQRVGHIKTDQSSSCPVGATPVLFPIVGSWDRGPDPIYDKNECVSDEEIGLFVHPELRGNFSLFPFHATTINNSNETYVKNCLTNPLVFSGYSDSSNAGGSSVLYFSVCMPNSAIRAGTVICAGRVCYPASYYQWTTPYNIGFYGSYSQGGVYDQNGNYGNKKPAQPLFSP